AISLKQKYGKNIDLMKADRATIRDGANTGATIISSYLIQGIVGLGVTMLFAALVYDWLFPAGGLLLSIAYGQGPGQANNFGAIYEGHGFTGGHSFAMSLVSIGFLVSSLVTVTYINILKRRGKLKVRATETPITQLTEDPNPEDEMPLSEPVDRLTMNISVIMFIFMITFGFLFGINHIFIESGVLGDFGVNTLRPVLFGFNFMFGILFAFVYKRIFVALKRRGYIKHEYTNNQTLNRIGGTMFDFMIIAGIILIDVAVLAELLPLIIILAVLGAAVTFFYIRFAAKHLAKGYETEHFVAMYAMMTGTISCGMGLLRIVDPQYKTKASDNLVLGSSFALAMGFPFMFLLTLAPYQPLLTWILLVVAFLGVNAILFRKVLFRRRATPIAPIPEKIDEPNPE
ncbi:MAG: hypothetical protein FWE38_05540, partial [Firmicutes bacterium]|nr:hypothetical protein [Bacillota bacterium]